MFGIRVPSEMCKNLYTVTIRMMQAIKNCPSDLGGVLKFINFQGRNAGESPGDCRFYFALKNMLNIFTILKVVFQVFVR